MTSSRTGRSRNWLFTIVVAGGVALSGCGSDEAAQTSVVDQSVSAAAQTAAGSSAVTIADSWVKATAGSEDGSMTAAFGVLTNPTDQDLTIVSATNSASGRTELHEMAMDGGAMVMRQIEGGIKIPAGGSTTLEPGGLHVMIMDVAKPIAPGEQVAVSLTLSDGSVVNFDALAKEFSGANEEYGGESSGMDMGESTGMDMGESTGMDMGGETSSTDG